MTSANGWTYIASGKISKVTPAAGQKDTKVTITGSSLLGGGKGVANVKLASVLSDAYLTGLSPRLLFMVTYQTPY